MIHVDANREYLDGAKTHKVMLPRGIQEGVSLSGTSSPRLRKILTLYVTRSPRSANLAKLS